MTLRRSMTRGASPALAGAASAALVVLVLGSRVIQDRVDDLGAGILRLVLRFAGYPVYRLLPHSGELWGWLAGWAFVLGYPLLTYVVLRRTLPVTRAGATGGTIAVLGVGGSVVAAGLAGAVRAVLLAIGDALPEGSQPDGFAAEVLRAIGYGGLVGLLVGVVAAVAASRR